MNRRFNHTCVDNSSSLCCKTFRNELLGLSNSRKFGIFEKHKEIKLLAIIERRKRDSRSQFCHHELPDCMSVTIPEECANDNALTFCHECILNLELWRCNRDQEIECSGRAKQVKARMAAKILSLPTNSEKDLVLDDKKKIAHQSVVVDQIRGQVRKQYNATVRLVKMEDCVVQKRRNNENMQERMVKTEEIRRVSELDKDSRGWLQLPPRENSDVEMETEPSTTVESSSKINVSSTPIDLSKPDERVRDEASMAKFLQGLLDQAADTLKEHDRLLKAWTETSKNSSLPDVPSPEQSETLVVRHEIPDCPYISPLGDLHSSPAELTDSPCTEQASSSPLQSRSSVRMASARGKMDNAMSVTKIGPDVYRFGDFPVQLVNGKYICLTCAAACGGKWGKRYMRQHIKSAHINFSSGKPFVREVGPGKYLYQRKVPFSEEQGGILSCGRCEFRRPKSEWKFFSNHLKYQHFEGSLRSKVQLPLKNGRVAKIRSSYYGISVIAEGSENHKCGACSKRFQGTGSKGNCRRHILGIHLGLRNWSQTVRKLGEGKFCYMNKIPFTFKDAGFHCGICPVKTSGHHEAILSHMALEHAEMIQSELAAGKRNRKS